MRELPKVRINDKTFYQDDRLREFRNVENPHDRMTFEEYRMKGRCMTCEVMTDEKVKDNDDVSYSLCEDCQEAYEEKHRCQE